MKPKLGILEKIRSFRRPTDASEVQQANIRFVIICGLTPYFFWYHYFRHEYISLQVFMILALFVLYSTSVRIGLCFDFLGPTIRRGACFLIDTIFICHTMHVGDRVCAPMALALYWQNTGYPFRFGEKFLVYGTVVSGVSFLTVILTTPYWQSNWEMAYATLLGFTAMPAFFVGKMVKKIRDAQRKAESANLIKSRFVSNMSHEMRTPLNGILGTTDLFFGTQVDPEQKDYLKTIKMSAQHMLSLVNDVLDISKIEEGKVAIVEEDMDLHALVKSTTAIVSRQITSKGLGFYVFVSPQVPFLVRGDITRLRQVLANLLSNAIKFTSAGQISVRVCKVGEDAERATMRFEVSDTGIGISSEQCAKIFERFTQANDSITRRFGGTGLGTTISKELVELMGGQIGVNSSEGKGSTFWFTVSLKKQNESAIPTAMAKPFMRSRILIVSANDKMADAITGYLSSLQVTHVKRAHNAGQAYEYANRTAKDQSFRHIAIVVKDSFGEDPFLFSEALEKMGIRKHIRLVLVGKVSEEDALRYGYRSIVESADIARDFLGAIHYALPYEDPQDENAFSPNTKSHKLKILVAEDNQINQMVIQKLLERAGHEVCIVNNGQEALGALEEKQFNVALLDLNMPVLGGIDTARKYLSAHKENPVPLIALTADATVESRKLCEEAGMKAFLTKPFETKKVFSIIHSIATSENIEEPPAKTSGSTTATTSFWDKAIDEDKLKELEEIGPSNDFVKNLVWVFVKDSEKHVRIMETALEQQDVEAFCTSAHSLKGIAGSMGALRVMDLANEMQYMRGKTPMVERYAKLADLKAEIHRVRKSLMRRYSVVDPVAG